MTVEHITDGTEIELLPPARPYNPGSVATLKEHVANMADAKMLADALCDTEMVPAAYRGKAGNGAAAILLGMELGLEPMQSLQQIFVVGGKPAIYARTAVALVKSRAGIIVQTVDSSDESVTVSATDPRTGQVEVSTWDLGRAERAGYVGNKKYTSDPQAMLYAKAAMEVCRKIAPDVLMGIPYAREELELDPQQLSAPRRVNSTRRGVDGLRAAIAPVIEPEIVGEEEEEDQEPAVVVDSGMSVATRSKWVKRLKDLLDEAEVDGEDRIATINEVLHREHPGTTLGPAAELTDLEDDELRATVTELNVMSKAGNLAASINDILNAAALRDAEVSA